MEHIDLTTAAILLAALAALLFYRFGLSAGAARSARHIADLEDDYTILQADYERVLDGSRKAAIARDNLQQTFAVLRISGAQVQQHSNRLTELAERLEAHAAPEKAAITEAAA